MWSICFCRYSEEADEDIHDLETPISTGNYFSRIQGLKEIKEVVEDDSGMGPQLVGFFIITRTSEHLRYGARLNLQVV